MPKYRDLHPRPAVGLRPSIPRTRRTINVTARPTTPPTCRIASPLDSAVTLTWHPTRGQ